MNGGKNKPTFFCQLQLECLQQLSLEAETLKVLKKLFTEHPETVGESYLGHMGMAFSFAGEMLACGVACLLHGLFPFLFVKTGSNAINRLYRKMVTHRDRHKPGTQASSPAWIEEDFCI